MLELESTNVNSNWSLIMATLISFHEALRRRWLQRLINAIERFQEAREHEKQTDPWGTDCGELYGSMHL